MVETEVRNTELIKNELRAALDANDLVKMSELSGELKKSVGSAEKIAKEQREQALVALTAKVKATFDKVAQKFVDSGELDSADGIFYTYDFGEKMATCRLTKTATRARTQGQGSTGAGLAKKYDISTDDLLKSYGELAFKVEGKDTEESLQQAFGRDLDKNHRYNVRKQLIVRDIEARK